MTGSSHTQFQYEEKWERTHRAVVSSREEEDDEGSLDNRQDGEPQQENVDEEILIGPWHFYDFFPSFFQKEKKSTDEELSFLCWGGTAVCVRLLPECKVWMWRLGDWLTSAVPWLLQRGIHMVLSPKCMLKVNTAGLQKILFLGIGPFLLFTTTYPKQRNEIYYENGVKSIDILWKCFFDLFLFRSWFACNMKQTL